ncbi:MAG: methionine adenosyltransferase [Thaumarchaeota archaeon]|nr:methionine adenosyltransferase [Nitrososphaerota archaeon]
MGKDFFHFEILNKQSVGEQEIEMVERKGKGHPDTLIDGACESVSRNLCKLYLADYGRILHHNVDKGLLVGGRSNPRFGGGEILEPIYVMVAGRATSFVEVDGRIEQIPVGSVALEAIKEHFKRTLRFLDVERHLIVDYRIRQGSSDLRSLVSRSLPLSNDTSVGVGFAPLTPTERLVLETEHYLNSDRLKKELPEVGEDVKVMALRKGKDIDLTIAAAMVSGLVPDKDHYISVVEEVKKRVEDLASKLVENDVKVSVNSADDYEKGIFYLTVTGTSAESGDDGNTGRGNRVNGLITPMREYSIEAAAGKNPINHTGKLFNVLSQMIADDIYKEVKGIKEVYVRMLSKIGSPITIPQMLSVAVIPDGRNVGNMEYEIEAISEDRLSRIGEISEKIVNGEISLY